MPRERNYQCKYLMFTLLSGYTSPVRYCSILLLLLLFALVNATWKELSMQHIMFTLLSGYTELLEVFKISWFGLDIICWVKKGEICYLFINVISTHYDGKILPFDLQIAGLMSWFWNHISQSSVSNQPFLISWFENPNFSSFPIDFRFPI